MHACDLANLDITLLLLDHGANPRTRIGTCTCTCMHMYMYVHVLTHVLYIDNIIHVHVQCICI